MSMSTHYIYIYTIYYYNHLNIHILVIWIPVYRICTSRIVFHIIVASPAITLCIPAMITIHCINNSITRYQRLYLFLISSLDAKQLISHRITPASILVVQCLTTHTIFILKRKFGANFLFQLIYTYLPMM